MLILTTLYYKTIVCFITVLITEVDAGKDYPFRKMLSLPKAVFYLAIIAFKRSCTGCRQTNGLNSSVIKSHCFEQIDHKDEVGPECRRTVTFSLLAKRISVQKKENIPLLWSSLEISIELEKYSSISPCQYSLSPALWETWNMSSRKTVKLPVANWKLFPVLSAIKSPYFSFSFRSGMVKGRMKVCIMNPCVIHFVICFYIWQLTESMFSQSGKMSQLMYFIWLSSHPHLRTYTRETDSYPSPYVRITALLPK